MSEATAAMPRAVRVQRGEDSSHWYHVDGRPCYELPKKDGSGTKTPTLADARKLSLLPSVTTILKILAKPALERWKIEQAVLAVSTSPRLPGEGDDAFIDRILNTERVQDQERDAAAKRGTDIHNALEALAEGQGIDDGIAPWVLPAWNHIRTFGDNYKSEVVLVGNGYAGKSDLIMDSLDPEYEIVVDYKTTKKLPEKASWTEHRLQLAAYAKAQFSKTGKKMLTYNLYVSTTELGKFALFENPPYEADYAAFRNLVLFWQWTTGYIPAA